jgi:hypothetical protein
VERRKESKAVSKTFIIDALTREAKKENPIFFTVLKRLISDDIFFGFIWRQGLAFRKPSSFKSLAKSESIRRVRGFWKYLLKILSGQIPIALGQTDTIHPIHGRFPFYCRKNKDEVPGVFGDTRRVISIRGESATSLRVLEGWGDRLCTMVLCAGPAGLETPIGVIFKGEGLKLPANEFEYYKSLKNIVVFFQTKAWVDTRIEMKLVEGMMKPIIAKERKSFVDLGQPFPGLLLIQDNFSPHFSEYVFIAKPILRSTFHIILGK